MKSLRKKSLSRRTFVKHSSLALTGIGLGAASACKSLSSPKANWQAKAPLPYHIQEVYCTALDGKIHLAGGFLVKNGQVSVSNHHLAYDPDLDQWSEISQIPAPRHHLQMLTHEGKLYAFGGFEAKGGQDNWIMHQQTWLFDTETQTWSVRAAAPEPHGESVAANLYGRLHIVGGRRPKGRANARYQDHQDSTSHLVYEPDGDRWAEAAPAPTARNSAAGAVIDGLWYVAGGRTVSGGNLASLEIYDPKEDKWRSATPMPQAQGGLAAAAVGGNLYAFGGEYFNNGGGVYSQTWCYQPKKDQWSDIGPMLTPRHGLAGIAIDNTIYAVAGAKKASLGETSNILEALPI